MPMIWALARGKLNSLSNRKREGKALAYIHVPFCATRCLYCMFYQNAYTDELADRYTDLLIKEMQLWADRRFSRKAISVRFISAEARRVHSPPPILVAS